MSPVRTRSQESLDKAAEEAEMLEAAEAQAHAEAEIGHRLPREVLNLTKRFKLQQQSLDTMQGNLSQLTDLVQQITLAMKPPPHPPQTEEHHDENRVPFSMPSQPQKHLSPIYEGETPQSAPSPSEPQFSMPHNSTSMPLVKHPHPSQVPHPKFTPPPPKPTLSQPLHNTSTYPMTIVPITTHIHSNTNLQTHPQAYQPLPQPPTAWPFLPQYPFPQNNYPYPYYPPTNFPNAQYPPYPYNNQIYPPQPMCSPQFTYTS
jgi:hypothetical protein